MPTIEQDEAATRYKRFRCPLQRSDGFWVVSDLYAAAFFVACGSEVTDIEPSGQPNRLSFVLCPRREFRSDVEKWKSNSPVPIRDFIDAVYRVKQRIRDFKKETNR